MRSALLPRKGLILSRPEVVPAIPSSTATTNRSVVLRRVVVTGRGVVTPLGSTTEDFWAALLAGRSGIGPITAFDTAGFSTTIAGEVRDFDTASYLPRHVSRRLTRFAQFGVGAALQALEAAKLEIDPLLAPRVGVLVGSGYGATALQQTATRILQDQGPRRVGSFLATASMDSPAVEIATRVGATGPCAATVAACATGTTCIGDAFRSSGATPTWCFLRVAPTTP